MALQNFIDVDVNSIIVTVRFPSQILDVKIVVEQNVVSVDVSVEIDVFFLQLGFLKSANEAIVLEVIAVGSDLISVLPEWVDYDTKEYTHEYYIDENEKEQVEKESACETLRLVIWFEIHELWHSSTSSKSQINSIDETPEISIAQN